MADQDGGGERLPYGAPWPEVDHVRCLKNLTYSSGLYARRAPAEKKQRFTNEEPWSKFGPGLIRPPTLDADSQVRALFLRPLEERDCPDLGPVERPHDLCCKPSLFF